MYCTLADVKAALNIEESKYNDRLDDAITIATEWIDTYCQYQGVDTPFNVSADSTRYFDRSCVRGKVLHTDMPFLSVTSVTNGDGLALASSAYRLMPRNHPRFNRITLKVSTDWLFIDADAEIEVTGRWGYSASVPTPVAEACMHLSGWLHQRWQSGLSASSATSELGTVKQVMDVPEHVKTLLRPYVYGLKML